MEGLVSINTYYKKEYPTLPLDGWLKPCTNYKCREITPIYTNYLFNNINFKFYFCYKCIDNINTVNYIEKYYQLVMERKSQIHKV